MSDILEQRLRSVRDKQQAHQKESIRLERYSRIFSFLSTAMVSGGAIGLLRTLYTGNQSVPFLNITTQQLFVIINVIGALLGAALNGFKIEKRAEQNRSVAAQYLDLQRQIETYLSLSTTRSPQETEAQFKDLNALEVKIDLVAPIILISFKDLREKTKAETVKMLKRLQKTEAETPSGELGQDK